MYKWMNVAIAITVSTFIALNLYLLFSDKSVIEKTVSIDRYERMKNGNFSEKMPKEGFIAPSEMYTIYVGNEDAVDTWLVKEGEEVTIGQELVVLQTERAEGQRAIWQAELNALREQERTIQNTISDLESDRRNAKSDNKSNVKKNDSTSKSTQGDKIEVGLNVDVQVDVAPDGPYAQAIGAAERELASVERQMVVVETQLEQNPSRPALVSPIDGTVANIVRHGTTLAVDIYSAQKEILTYIKNNEWEKLQTGNHVYIQGKGLDQAIEGTVQSVSQTPANEDRWFAAYKAVDPQDIKNPLGFYEVRIGTEADLQSLPFGTNVNAAVVVNEVLDTLSVNAHWLYEEHQKKAFVWKLDGRGRVVKEEVATPFTWKNRSVVTVGLQLGDVVVDRPVNYEQSPRVFLPFPGEFPNKSDWKAFGWKNYMKYAFLK
ncbi:HlyD family efflux transporter periplasmic adaptor subunit [Sporosarcina sp. HYO08]|uniref:HlyD family efflux transporter periplasmic adaptor subunit n=1 Tax=Sporosarcina sp. HYO08 TaxID=1759557 RepID=UPI000794C9A6|nr:HlyD family efflux transporter periplasmic adaptor subunit [Sporosarcina sp. HYO08]KXH84007.1 hypothetical protein AU377_04440 [Sporosarcina sp. HYO08]